MANEQLGPVENGLNTGVNWVINNLVPKDSQQAWKDNYAANRSLWNTGIVGAGLAGTAALTGVAANAFNSNDNGNNNGGGGGSSWGWLLPVAGLAGAGLWAWNKWGGDLKSTLNN